jgi:hypothetical protein
MMFQELIVRAESTLITVLPPRFVNAFEMHPMHPMPAQIGWQWEWRMKTHDDNRNNRQLDATMSYHYPCMEDHVSCIEFA